jgi:hypothetical protein
MGDNRTGGKAPCYTYSRRCSFQSPCLKFEYALQSLQTSHSTWSVYEGTTIDSYTHTLLRGICTAAIEQDCNLLIGCGISLPGSPRRSRTAWSVPGAGTDSVPVGPWNTDGLIIIPDDLSDAQFEYVRDLIRSDYPVILTTTEKPGPRVAVDNAGGIRQAFEHLLQHGHERIAFIAGKAGRGGDSAERLAAYRLMLREADLDFDERLIAFGEHRRDRLRRHPRGAFASSASHHRSTPHLYVGLSGRALGAGGHARPKDRRDRHTRSYTTCRPPIVRLPPGAHARGFTGCLASPGTRICASRFIACGGRCGLHRSQAQPRRSKLYAWISRVPSQTVCFTAIRRTSRMNYSNCLDGWKLTPRMLLPGRRPSRRCKWACRPYSRRCHTQNRRLPVS